MSCMRHTRSTSASSPRAYPPSSPLGPLLPPLRERAGTRAGLLPSEKREDLDYIHLKMAKARILLAYLFLCRSTAGPRLWEPRFVKSASFRLFLLLGNCCLLCWSERGNAPVDPPPRPRGNNWEKIWPFDDSSCFLSKNKV